jgi:zinc D-Ala-D-Ala carboxypeptidase
MNPSDKISDFFSYGEATHSETAMRNHIDNTPDQDSLDNLVYTAKMLADPCRKFVGGPLYGMFFRSPALNAIVKGADPTSLHMVGQAVDLDCKQYGHGDNKELFDFIRTKLDFDKVIWEHGDEKEPSWIHVQIKKNGPNRKLVLRRYEKKDAQGNYIEDVSVPFDLY